MPQAADKGKIGFEQEEEENSCGRCNFNKEQEAREQARWNVLNECRGYDAYIATKRMAPRVVLWSFFTRIRLLFRVEHNSIQPSTH